MGHGHSHGHDHHHHAPSSVKILIIAVFLAFGFAAVEAFFGWYAHSLALMSDAGHMASDGLGLILAAFAAWVAAKPPSEGHTYGYGRAEVLGAWASSLLILGIAIVIIVEAVRRLHEPEAVHGTTIIWVALIGVFINLLIAYVLTRGEKTLNIRAAIIHVLGDLAGTVAALIAGAVIYYTGWMPIDAILSIFISILILISSYRILKESMVVLMEGVPHHLDVNDVGKAMVKANNVDAVHDLHIWTLSSGVVLLSAHVDIDDYQHWDSILTELTEILEHEFSITHITLQPECHTQVLKRL